MRVLWQFISFAYAGGKTAWEDAKRAGFTETAWTECKRVLDAAGVTEKTRAGDAAGWLLTPETAEACWHEVMKGKGGFYVE
jgi:hypothetical protein